MCNDRFCERPKTIRRYVHPPLSERFFSLWAEGKILFGEYDVDRDRSRITEGRDYNLQISCGVWPVLGRENQRMLDFRKVKNVISRDGTPIHGLIFREGDLEVELECFSNSVRKSTLFGKMEIRNKGTAPVSEILTVLLRTTMERDLVCGGPDGYVSHDPKLEQWKNVTCCWYPLGDGFTDGERQIAFSCPVLWHKKLDGVEIPLNLNGGECFSFTFKLDKGEVSAYDYEEEKAKTVAFWQKEFSRINKLPAKITEDPAMMKAVRHMVAQLLQMTVYTKDNWVIPRQGNLQRIIWATEAMFHVEGICHVGEFDEYVEPIFRTYFEHLQESTGEIGPLGIYWGSMTAAVLFSFAQYCNATKNLAFFGKYRDKAYAAFRFIKDLRRSVVDTEELAGGLFPYLRGIDWTQQFQCWTSTDIFNLLGLDALAKTFAVYGDPAAEEIRREHTEYLADMKRHFKKYYDAQEGSEELRIPLKPMGDDRDLVEDFYPLLYQGRFVYAGVIDNEKDMLRVYNHMIREGITQEGLGLYGHMPYRNGNNNIWYLSFPDIYWFEIWMQYGNREKAKEVLDAQLRYAMTEEYYFAERLDAKDPYFVPWSPNASATGRTLTMLKKYYS